MMGEGIELIWVTERGEAKSLRGKRGITRDRHGVVKFEKSLCSRCNNAESQTFDRAYDKFAEFVHGRNLGADLSFEAIYGDSWSKDTPDLGRYFVKHFGCRIARSRLPLPNSLRGFLNGANDMDDAQMCFIEDRSIPYEVGEYTGISEDIVFTSSDGARIDGYVFVYYFGRYGVRFEWLREGIPESRRVQFFHYPGTLIPLFRDGTPWSPVWKRSVGCGPGFFSGRPTNFPSRGTRHAEAHVGLTTLPGRSLS